MKVDENSLMCRLFAFRSIINSQVHSSLIRAENTLHDLSQKHPDGWGVAYYIDDTPHLIKSTDCAMDDHIFHKVSGVVSSQTVLAHIRKATHGSHSILNSHPFQYGKWTFAHNGNIRNFESLKTELMELVDQDLKRFILGSTDSEIIFFIFLSAIKKHFPLASPINDIEILSQILEKSLNQIIQLSGLPTHRNDPTPTENYYSFIITNGSTMLAFNGGQDLFYCTYKTKCPERNSCSHYAPFCEAPPESDGKINHLICSSEKISGVNVWTKLSAGELIGITNKMCLFKTKLKIDFL